MNLGKREAQPLSLQDQLEPNPITGAVESRRSLAPRMQQAFILVESQRPQAQTVHLSKVADRVFAGARELTGRRGEGKVHAHQIAPRRSFLSKVDH